MTLHVPPIGRKSLPAAKIPPAAKAGIVVPIVVSILLFFILPLLPLILVVLSIVIVVRITLLGPFADRKEDGENRGEDPSGEEGTAGSGEGFLDLCAGGNVLNDYPGVGNLRDRDDAGIDESHDVNQTMNDGLYLSPGGDEFLLKW